MWQNFNSRPSARGDRFWTALFARILLFQFTPLREGRRRAASSQTLPAYFNSRPSARGDGSATVRRQAVGYFNSRPSARGDWTIEPQDERKLISIHAPPRGATPFRGREVLFRRISIHAPPRGATRGVLLRRRLFPYFNSRPSARGDGADRLPNQTERDFNSRPSARGDPPEGFLLLRRCISIHAPPRGATDAIRQKRGKP